MSNDLFLIGQVLILFEEGGVLGTYMFLERYGIEELFHVSTIGASEGLPRLLRFMGNHVLLQVRAARKGSFTLCALKGLLACMNSFMSNEI